MKQIFLEYTKAQKEQLIETCSLGISMGVAGSDLLRTFMIELLKIEGGLMLTSNPNDLAMLSNPSEQIIAQLVEVKE